MIFSTLGHTLAAVSALVFIGISVFLPAQGGVLGDDDLAGGILDAIAQGIGTERAEHHRVDRANPGAGQHGDRQLRNHLQVHANPVAFLDAERLEDIGEFAHFTVELPVGQLGILPGLVAFPDDGGLVTSRLQVPIQTIDRDVGFATGKPFDIQVLRLPLDRERIIADLTPFLLPDELLGDFAPESFWILDRPLIHRVILRKRLEVRLGGKVRRWRYRNLNGGRGLI